MRFRSNSSLRPRDGGYGDECLKNLPGVRRNQSLTLREWGGELGRGFF
jgi:hypothetical protein